MSFVATCTHDRIMNDESFSRQSNHTGLLVWSNIDQKRRLRGRTKFPGVLFHFNALVASHCCWWACCGTAFLQSEMCWEYLFCCDLYYTSWFGGTYGLCDRIEEVLFLFIPMFLKFYVSSEARFAKLRCSLWCSAFSVLVTSLVPGAVNYHQQNNE